MLDGLDNFGFVERLDFARCVVVGFLHGTAMDTSAAPRLDPNEPEVE